MKRRRIEVRHHAGPSLVYRAIHIQGMFAFMRCRHDGILWGACSIERDSDHPKSPDISMTGQYQWMAGVGRNRGERAWWRARKWKYYRSK